MSWSAAADVIVRVTSVMELAIRTLARQKAMGLDGLKSLVYAGSNYSMCGSALESSAASLATLDSTGTRVVSSESNASAPAASALRFTRAAFHTVTCVYLFDQERDVRIVLYTNECAIIGEKGKRKIL